MSEFDRFDEQLDAALEAVRRGRPLDAALSDQRPYDAALRPLVETGAALEASPRAPFSRNLTHNYAIVQAAVERAQMSARSAPATTASATAPWWKRRLTFASLSLPAGAVALVLTAGAAAGATASVVTTDLGYEMADAVLPEIVAEHVPGAPHKDASPHANGPLPGGNPGAPSLGNDGDGSDNGPVAATIEGEISEVNGNTFTLTNGDGEWHVQMDSATEIEGEVLEGAAARVTGAVTAGKNMHASAITASGGERVDPPGGDRTPEPNDTPKPDKTTGSDGTPGSSSTPKPDKTPGPPEDPGGEQGNNRPDAPPGGSAGDVTGNEDGGGNRKP